VKITYDPVRREVNLRRYEIDLADVEDVFTDIFALTQENQDNGKVRFVTLGTDSFGRLLVVTYTYHGQSDVRVLSARHANEHEQRCYEEG